MISRSYSCHQRRLSEINNRKNSNDKNYINIIESSRRNKFFNSRRKEIKKQEEILSQNKKLLNKIVNIKSSFYRSSSRQSISSNCSKQSSRSIEQKEKNIQRIKDNQITRQKISQIKSTFKSIPTERTSRDSLRRPIYQIEDTKRKEKCLQVQKISQVRLLSFPSVRGNNKPKIFNPDNSGIGNTLPAIKKHNYQIIARMLKDKLYNN
ncbi:unnamed protein product [Paramecium primaurelia]|uniref:Uncharacterized protein n=1 Tax=Paramecium primaurelia TaxID=5886 RepID=A0A8S1K9P9_PARPR|nr:unnamed protein product [Paramecium primaurelia]